MLSFPRFAFLYLLSQGVGGIIWWIALFEYPTIRRSFISEGSPDSMLLAFFLPDCLIFVGGSFLSAYALSKSRSWALAALLLHAGGSSYAGLYCWGLVVVSAGDGLLGAIMMTPPMIIPLVIAIVWQKRIIQHAG